MKTGRYSLSELLTHNEIEQFIVPELQRDYVWNTDQVSKILESLITKFKQKKNINIEVFSENKPLQDLNILNHLSKEYSVLKFKHKFGFLYAYHDKGFPGKFFLIDGQQRITTFFLLLLALYIKLNKSEEFRKKYFFNKIPKLDYKVRASAHDFLIIFIEDLLKGKNFRNNPDFFEEDCRNDVTVHNIIFNYEYIVKKIGEYTGGRNEYLETFLEYIEDYVEFNYFDTNLSDQGEKLYLYMNSRGYRLSHQEVLRAKLIEKCGKNQKISAGQKWEEWQDYFFEKRLYRNNENADEGFAQFLNHVSLLKKWMLNGELTKDDIEKRNDLEFIKPFQFEELNIYFIESCYKSLRRLLEFDFKQNKPVLEGLYFEGGDTMIKIYRFLPVIFYMQKFGEASVSESDLENLTLLILNQSHTRAVSDEPTAKFQEVLKFIDHMGSADVFSNKGLFLDYFRRHEYEKQNWLQDIYLKERLQYFLRNLYFDLNFNEFLEGDTELLFDLSYNYTENSKFDFEILARIIHIMRRIFFVRVDNDDVFQLEKSNKGSKFLRKYILAYFDYRTHMGYSYKYETHKYGLIPDDRAWLGTVCRNRNFNNIIKNWIENNTESVIDDLNRQFVKLSDFDWRYYFIKYGRILGHCGNNQFLFHEELQNIILLVGKRPAQGDVYLMAKLFTLMWKSEELPKVAFRNHVSNICFTDLVLYEESVVASYFKDIPRIAIDFVYIEHDQKWQVEVFFKGENKEIFESFNRLKDTEGWIEIKREETHRLVSDKYIYQHDSLLSLEDNILKLHQMGEDLIFVLQSGDYIPVVDPSINNLVDSI